MRRRALELFQRRRETLRTGWSALRWGDARVLGLACRELVHETAGALPVDTAAGWLAGAPESARATADVRVLQVALRHARDYDDPRLDGELDAVVDELPCRRRPPRGGRRPDPRDGHRPHARRSGQTSRRRRAGAIAARRRRRAGAAFPPRSDAGHDRLAGRRCSRRRGRDRGDVDRRRAGADPPARRPPARQHAGPVRPGRGGGGGLGRDARLPERLRPHASPQGPLAGWRSDELPRRSLRSSCATWHERALPAPPRHVRDGGGHLLRQPRGHRGTQLDSRPLGNDRRPRRRDARLCQGGTPRRRPRRGDGREGDRRTRRRPTGDRSGRGRPVAAAPGGPLYL